MFVVKKSKEVRFYKGFLRVYKHEIKKDRA